MLTNWSAVTFVILMVAGANGVLLLFHRLWPASKRREHNDLIGWQISVTGTTYAVVIGFMLYAVWNDFQEAEINAEAEANSIVNIVRSSQGLPESPRLKIKSLSDAYVDSMLNEEWPAMKQNQFAIKPASIIEDLWQAVTSTRVNNSSEEVSLDQTLTQLSAMTEHRRLRHQQATSGIPFVLWFVLITGAVVVITSACMFGSLNFQVQLVQVSLLSLMLALIIAAIADLNNPFRGAVTVSPTGFEQARSTLKHR